MDYDRQVIIGVAGAGIAILGIVIGAIWLIPRTVAKRFARGRGRSSSPKELFDIENETRKTIAQVVGGIVIVIGLGFTSLQLANTQRTFKLSERGQITDRYAEAVKQLDLLENSEPVRIGAIYALERIALDSEVDVGEISEVLAAYVRLRSPAGAEINAGSNLAGATTPAASEIEELEPIANDAAAAVQAIAKINQLRSSDAPCLQLTDAYLVRLEISKSDLSNICFDGSDLRHASFMEVDLSRSSFNHADLSDAQFTSSDLTGASIIFSKNIGTDYFDAVLEGTVLQFTNLSQARGLTIDQLESSCFGSNTLFPPDVGSKVDPSFRDQNCPDRTRTPDT